MRDARSTQRLGCACAALLLGACSVTGLKEKDSPIAQNQCESSSECGSSARCVEGMCAARNGSLTRLLIEVSPSGNSGDIAGEHFFELVEFGSPPWSLDLTLDEVPLRGHVTAKLPAGCAPVFVATTPGEPSGAGAQLLDPLENGRIPVRVTFIPSEGVLALPVVPRTAIVDTAAVGTAAYEFSTRLPDGKYDIYVEPFDQRPVSDMMPQPVPGSCGLAPLLIRGQEITRVGSTEAVLELALPAPRDLDVDVRWPEGARDLRDWTVDVIEDDGGRVISNRVRLVAPANENGTLVYSARLAYLPVVDARPYGTAARTSRELVRLTPPEGVLAPTVFFDRMTLETFSPGSAVIDHLPTFETPVLVEGAVVEASSGAGRGASLEFTASELAGASEGTAPGFSRSIDTHPENGTFKVQLLPGTYRVRAVPNAMADTDTRLAMAEATWTIAPLPLEQAGRNLQLPLAATISGHAALLDGPGGRGAIVTAQASPWKRTLATLTRETRGDAALPRATSMTVTAENGEFALFADAGVFDFSVRTPEGSNLAWFVMPGLTVPDAGVSLTFDVALPPPVRIATRVMLTGDASAMPTPQQRLIGAWVRAYALVDRDGGFTDQEHLAESAIQVAQSRLDTEAATTLLVPASLDTQPVDP